MRDFRNAKAMAQTLRQALKTKSVDIAHSESLELTAQMLGFRGWNVLAAPIQDEKAPTSRPAVLVEPPIGLPVVAMRDIVIFPETTAPLFVGRPRTVRAVERAMTGDKRVLLLAQKRAADNDPDADALYDVGVVATLLDVMKLPDGTMRLMVRGLERARITRLVHGELLQAEYEPISQPPAGERGDELVGEVLKAFEQYANVNLASPPQALMMLSRVKDPGLLADLLVQHMPVSLDQWQDLLETLDPAERLEKLAAIMRARRQAA